MYATKTFSVLALTAGLISPEIIYAGTVTALTVDQEKTITNKEHEEAAEELRQSYQETANEELRQPYQKILNSTVEVLKKTEENLKKKLESLRIEECENSGNIAMAMSNTSRIRVELHLASVEDEESKEYLSQIWKQVNANSWSPGQAYHNIKSDCLLKLIRTQ